MSHHRRTRIYNNQFDNYAEYDDGFTACILEAHRSSSWKRPSWTICKWPWTTRGTVCEAVLGWSMDQTKCMKMHLWPFLIIYIYRVNTSMFCYSNKRCCKFLKIDLNSNVYKHNIMHIFWLNTDGNHCFNRRYYYTSESPFSSTPPFFGCYSNIM